LLLAIGAAAGWVIAEFARLAGAYQPRANCTRFPCGDNVTGTVARLRPWSRTSTRQSPRLWPSRRSAIPPLAASSRTPTSAAQHR